MFSEAIRPYDLYHGVSSPFRARFHIILLIDASSYTLHSYFNQTTPFQLHGGSYSLTTVSVLVASCLYFVSYVLGCIVCSKLRLSLISLHLVVSSTLPSLLWYNISVREIELSPRPVLWRDQRLIPAQFFLYHPSSRHFIWQQPPLSLLSSFAKIV